MEKELMVLMGRYIVVDEPCTIRCLGLGSCVAIGVFDKENSVGGLGHAMLPGLDEDRKGSGAGAGRYVDAMVGMLIKDIMSQGGDRSRMKAKMAGGAQMFNFISTDALDVGRKNIESARKVLSKNGIELVGEDVGGNRSRTVDFEPTKGRMRIVQAGSREKLI